MRPEAKITKFCWSFWFVEIATWFFHLSFTVAAFGVLDALSFVVCCISLVFSMFCLGYKKGRHNIYTSFKQKKVMVGTSCLLLAVEDIIFTAIQLMIVSQIYGFDISDAINVDNSDNNEDGSEGATQEFTGVELIDSEFLYIFALSLSVLMLLMRTNYILGHLCCANPDFTDEIIKEEIVNPESDESYFRMTIIPHDIREELRVRIEKEGCASTLFYAIFPGLVTIAIVGLFVAATVIDLEQPEIQPNSVFRNFGTKAATLATSGTVTVIGLIVLCGCQGWKKGFCVPDDAHHVIPKKERAVLGLRGLEIADYITDLGSVVLLFNSFRDEVFWQIVMVSSMVVTLFINVLYYCMAKNKVNKDYQGKKQKIALSILLLAVEDIIMLPINAIFVQEAEEGEIPDVERAAVILSVITGGVLALVRLFTIFHHLCCGRAIYVGGLRDETGRRIV